MLRPIIETVDARMSVTDDADALKTTANENGIYHQVFKAMTEAILTLWSNNCKPSLPMVSTRLWSKSESLSNKPNWTYNA